MNELALFAGAGGGILAGQLLGWRTVCAVERDAYAAQILAQRQNDGCLEPFPIWSDVCSFDGRPWRGIVDVVSGGFPCQDISAAGRGAGIKGARSGLWKHMARIIRDVAPRFVLVENSPVLTIRGLGTVLGDLAEIGYDAQWRCVSAAECGAPHLRDRIWIVAYTRGERSGCRSKKTERKARSQINGHREKSQVMANSNIQHDDNAGYGASEISQQQAATIQQSIANTEGARLPNRRPAGQPASQGKESRPAPFSGFERCGNAGWATEPLLGRVADGVAHRVDRIRAIGNGQVPIVATTAWSILNADI